jgi:hypothetical protein
MRSLEVRMKLVGIMLPCGMLLFLIPAASKVSFTIDLLFLDCSIVTFNSLYL